MIKMDCASLPGTRGLHPYQDYCIVKDGALVLSDGCSSSMYTDLGARLLCLTQIKDPAKNVSWWTPKRAVQLLGIDDSCLDCTLITVYSSNPEGVDLKVKMIGDGVIAQVDKSGFYLMEEICFDENTPFYVSYITDGARRSSWAKVTGGIEVTRYSNSANTEEPRTIKRDYTPIVDSGDGWATLFEHSYPVLPGWTVIFATDGISSFTDKDNKLVPPGEIVKFFSNPYASSQGSFAQRRMNKFKGWIDMMGWESSDDFSIGVVLNI